MAATITLSLEIELAWGFHDIANDFSHLSPRREVETRMLGRLLRLCEKHSLPFSFDVVGYLLHQEYQSIRNSPHDEEWLPVPEGSDKKSHPLFYAPDLIDKIVRSDVEHEIASHTYTHSILGESSAEVVNWELETARKAHREYGLSDPVSLVPPRHSEPSLELLEENRFEIIRSAVFPRMDSNLKQYFHFLTRSSPVNEPDLRDGIVHTYCTQNPSLTAPFFQNGQDRAHLTFRALPNSVRRYLHQRFLQSALERAISTDSHAHFWSHLFNLSNEEQWPLVEGFLEELGRRQERGEIEIRLMNELTDGV